MSIQEVQKQQQLASQFAKHANQVVVILIHNKHINKQICNIVVGTEARKGTQIIICSDKIECNKSKAAPFTFYFVNGNFNGRIIGE